MTTISVSIRATVAIFVLCQLSGCSHRIAGGIPGQWELRGAIVDVSPDLLRVQHKTGQVVDMILDDCTEIVQSERPATRDVLRPGARVQVTVEPLAGGARRAKAIHVYGGGRREGGSR